MKWFNTFERFDRTALPAIDKFKSTLTDKDISVEDNERAQNAWEHFKCKTFKDYHDIYLSTDVCLLMDVLGAFTEISYKDYGIDPIYYMSLPQYSWDSMLLITGIALHQLSYIDMYVLCERVQRGGISQISCKYAEANNKYMGDDYNPYEPRTCLTYQDANHLYGASMRDMLPLDNFEWSEDMLTAEAILAYDKESEHGYFLDVDLGYPEHLHDARSDYPMRAAASTITVDMLSPYSKEQYKHYHTDKKWNIIRSYR